MPNIFNATWRYCDVSLLYVIRFHISVRIVQRIPDVIKLVSVPEVVFSFPLVSSETLMEKNEYFDYKKLDLSVLINLYFCYLGYFYFPCNSSVADII